MDVRGRSVERVLRFVGGLIQLLAGFLEGSFFAPAQRYRACAGEEREQQKLRTTFRFVHAVHLLNWFSKLEQQDSCHKWK